MAYPLVPGAPIVPATYSSLNNAFYSLSGVANFADFIAVHGGGGDGSSDNAAALVAFNTWAKAESAAGRGVILHVPPGTYNYNHVNCIGYLQNISKLHIIGHGAIFQNTYDRNISGANAGYEQSWGYATGIRFFAGDNNSALIVTTVEGDTVLTLLDYAGNNAIFAVGDKIGVGSKDIQYYGYPQNLDQWEFVTVVSKNAGAGTITVTPALRYAHRSDSPDGPNPNPCGAARMWRLNHLVGDPINFNVEHTYEGLEIRPAPNAGSMYIALTGAKHTWIDCITPGYSPTVLEYGEVIRGRTTGENEFDKLVGTFIMRGHIAELDIICQSSSIDSILLDSVTVKGMLAPGPTKNFKSINCSSRYTSEGAPGQNFGCGRSITHIGGNLRGFINAPAFGGEVVAIDGTNVSYANGIFSVLKAAPTDQVAKWGVIEGTVLTFNTASYGAALPRGEGVITRIYEDATHLHFRTTCHFATVPAWATGVILNRGHEFNVIGCGGSRNARMYSKAYAKGKKPWEYLSFTLAGVTSASGYWSSYIGELERVIVNVRQVGPLAGSKLDLTWHMNLTNDAGGDPLAGPSDLVALYDLMTLGRREYDISTLLGVVGTDTLKLAGVDQTPLPSNRWFRGVSPTWAAVGYTPSSYADYQLPVVDVEMFFRTDSQARELITTLKDDDPASILVGISGTLP